ncbi:cDNA sequence BC056474, partial [Mus musculus]
EVALLAVKEGRRGLQFAMSTNNMSDPRRPNKVLRYKPPPSECNPALDDPTPDYMNLLGMIFSMCGLMLKLKWCAWVAVYCSFISFANSRSSEDTKQMMSSFMLSISAVVMSYLQNPQPMTPPW